MASIRKRGKSWQAQVRSRTTGSIGKSFHRKADAERWAIEQEALMQTSQFKRVQTKDLNLADLMHSYAEKVTPTKRGATQTTHDDARAYGSGILSVNLSELSESPRASKINRPRTPSILLRRLS